MGAYNYVFYLLLTWLPSYLSFALHLICFTPFSTPACPGSSPPSPQSHWRLARGLPRQARLQRDAGAQGGPCRRHSFGLGILGAAHAHSATQAPLDQHLHRRSGAASPSAGRSALIAGRNDVGKVGGIMNFSNQISGVAAPIVTDILSRPSTPTHGIWRRSRLSRVGIAAYIVLWAKSRWRAPPSAARAVAGKNSPSTFCNQLLLYSQTVMTNLVLTLNSLFCNSL